MNQVVINRQLMGLEDLLFGVGIETQTRGGETGTVTKINAANLPFDETKTLLQWAQENNFDTITNFISTFLGLEVSIESIGSTELAEAIYEPETNRMRFRIPYAKTAYNIAVDNGFVGTEIEWLATLEGPQGIQGPEGPQGIKGDVGSTQFEDLNNKPTTLNGYGIVDAYTKTEVDLITGNINSALDIINGEVI